MVEVSEAAKAKASELLRNIVPGFEPDVCAFIQEVSDAAREVYGHFSIPGQHDVRVGPLTPFILPEPVDLLEEAVSDVWPHVTKPTAAEVTNALRAALSKRGLKIVPTEAGQ